MSIKLDQRELLAAEVAGLLDLQRELLAIVARRGDLAERLDQVCRLFEQAVDGMVATVMQLDAEGRYLDFVSSPSAPKELVAELNHARLGDGNGSCAFAAWSGHPAYVGKANQDAHWRDVRETAERFGVQSCWSAPACDSSGKVCGTFALTSFSSRLPNTYQRQLLDLGALTVGLLFEQEADKITRAENDLAKRSLAMAADASPNGILFTGTDHGIEWSNAGAQHLLERSAAELRDHSLYGCLGLDEGDGQLSDMFATMKKRQVFSGTLHLKRPSGKRWLAQVSSTSRPGTDEAGAVIMLVDVTNMHRLLEFNVLLAKVDHALAQATDPDSLLQTICDLTVRHVGFSLAWIGRPDETSGWFHFMASAGPGKAYLDHIRISSRAEHTEGQGPSGSSWRDGKSRFECTFADSPGLKPWAQLARRHGFSVSAVLPIQRGGRPWAQLVVYHSELDTFDETLQQLLETLALNISTGLDRFDLARKQSESQALNETMLDSATVGVVLTRGRVVLRANRRAAEILGATGPDALEGTSTLAFYADSKVGLAAADEIREAFEAGRRAILEIDGRRVDGNEVRLRLEGAPLRREGYDEVWTLTDQTEQHRALETQRLLANALASVQEGVILTDVQQRTVYINEAFTTLTGYDFDQMRGRKCSILQGPESDPGTIKRIHDALAQEQAFVGDILNYRRDGSRFWNQLMINPLRDEQGRITHFVGVQRDITNIRELNARLEHLAYHDELTGLPNRRALDRYFAQELPVVGKTRHVLAVAIIDLDDFKIINDTHGHVCGDRLLKTVAKRIQPFLRKQDFFARLGGDEFVIVFHEKFRLRAESRLSKRFEAIGGCFADPFEIGNDVSINIGLSMGVALMPKHAAAGGMLLRLADDALFRAKKHKQEEHPWWWIYGESQEQEPEASMPVYGEATADLLERAHEHLNEGLGTLVDEFYDALVSDPHASGILDGLLADEFEHLKQRQLDHIEFLLSGDITRDDVIEMSSRAGRSHALVGVDSALLMRWMSQYHESLVAVCKKTPLPPKDRYQLLQVVEHRLQHDLQFQLEGLNATHDRYAAVIDQPIPSHGANWNDAIGIEIRSLGRLPGVICGLVLRQNAQQTYSIEWATGASGHAAARLLLKHYGENDSEYIAPPDDTLIARSWQAVETFSLPNLLNPEDATEGQLPGGLIELGVRSVVCVPIHDDKQLPVAMILLFGSFPNQFESRQMRQFKRNLQMRGNEIWQRSMLPAPAISHEQATSFRRRLFNDGLHFHLQPVIDLGTGKLVKVEALARLKLADGSLVRPDVFLPLLRQNELNALFERGLDITLGQLVALRDKGLDLDMALNIAPSTLSEPNCFSWVMRALQDHAIEPHRLVLEILENQRVDRKARDATVTKLVAEGVRFAIDDLGSGYSSLRRLASLPFHALKVDQDLLANLHRDPVQTISLVSAVIQIGRDFGCEVIAEGLEDPGMTEVARLLGASMGQGYGIAAPMPFDELLDWSRGFTWNDPGRELLTPLGAVAFQWISLRHGSLHPPEHDDCPLTRVLQAHPDRFGHDCDLHKAVHARPHDKETARQLLECLQDAVQDRRRDDTTA